MTSLVRTVLSSILCCVIAFGHAPAWLHVATCEDGCGDVKVVASDFGDAAGEDIGSVCPHGCCHHSSDVSEPDASGEGDDRPADQHDSDTCSICQSLASSVGVVSLALTPAAPEYVCEASVLVADQQPTAALFSIAKPRGPPAVA